KIPSNRFGLTKLPDGFYPAGLYGKGETAAELLQSLEVRDGKIVSDVHIRARFVWGQQNLEREMAEGAKFFLRTKNMSLRAVKSADNQGQKGLSTLITKDVATNEDASTELSDILSSELNELFQYSKPVELVKLLVRAATYNNRDAIVMDSFA